MAESSASESDVVRGAARAMESVESAYNDLYGLRALVSLIPGVGGALDLLLSGEGAAIEKRRLAKQLEDLRLEMAMVDVAKLDRDFLHSEECYDWFALFVERTVRTANEEKLSALRRVFIQGLRPAQPRGSQRDHPAPRGRHDRR